MGEQKEEDLYRNFSRKDLQGLCKKYGLPANKSNSEMATSLILYLEKKNLSSRSIWEGSDFFALGTKELQSGVRMDLTNDQRKDSKRKASHSGSGNNPHHNHRDVQQNDLQKFNGFATSDKVSEDVGILKQLQKESNSGIGFPENTFSSVLSSTAVTPSPTFTFDVCCEDGIQLSVDLDSNPSDWIENLKAGVHICDGLHKPKSQSFHEDIGLLCSKEKSGSVVMDPSNETDTGQLEERSFPTTLLTDIQAQTDEADTVDRFLSPPGIEPVRSVGDSLEKLKEMQALSSSRLESGNRGQLPSARSSRSEQALATDVNAAVQTGMFNLSGNSLLFDPKSSGMPAHKGGSAGDDGLDKKLSLQQSHSSLDPVMKCGELSTVVCMEMQGSTGPTISQDVERFSSRVGKCVNLSEQLKDTEVVQCGIAKSVQTIPSMNAFLTTPAQAVNQSECMPFSILHKFSAYIAENKRKADAEQGNVFFSGKFDRQIREAHTHSAENAGFLTAHEASGQADEMQKKDAAHSSNRSLDFVVPKQNGMDHHIYRSPSASKGKSNNGNERDRSECLNFDKLMEKPCKEPVDSESDRELKKKRHLNSVDGQNKFANTDAKLLRSMQFAGDAHSKRRRSSRLFTKVGFICWRTHIQRKNNGATYHTFLDILV